VPFWGTDRGDTGYSIAYTPHVHYRRVIPSHNKYMPPAQGIFEVKLCGENVVMDQIFLYNENKYSGEIQWKLSGNHCKSLEMSIWIYKF
jgi:hypothetical protein